MVHSAATAIYAVTVTDAVKGSSVEVPGITAQDDVAADFFQVLASPIRLAIVRMLLDGERYVGDLMTELGIAQPRLSNHLACLRQCGFVQSRREGTYVYYGLAEPHVADMVRLAETMARSRASALTQCEVIRSER